jgi:superfamily I DNA/RNA helicase
MTNDDTILDDDQRAAACSNAQYLAVIAGVGSGKTRTLLNRIKNFAPVDYVDASDIALVTFTNDAARDMTERLRRLTDARLGYVGTVHGMCLRYLQLYGSLIGYSVEPIALLDDEAAAEVLWSVADLLGYKNRSDAWLLAARDQRGTYAMLDRADRSSERVITATYYTRLIASNATDYTGLITEATRLLEVGAAFPWRHLFVDEYQDLSRREHDLFSMVRRKEINTVTVVGDTDQALYAWRGSDPDVLHEVAARSEVVTMSRNYRSDREVCAAANRLIAHNRHRRDKRIVPVSEADGDVDVWQFPSDAHEIMAVAAAIGRITAAGPAPGTVAVLARTNAVVRQARAALEASGVVVARPRELRRDADVLKPVLALVDALATPTNDLAIFRYLCTVNPTMAEAVRRDAMLKQVPMRDLVPTALAPFAVHVSSDQLDALSVVNVCASVLTSEQVDFLRRVFQTLPDAATAQDLAIALRTEQFERAPSGAADGVTVSTVHGAKGMEWDSVFVIALEDEVTPANRTDVEEERRLLYVAMTRARHLLVLTYADVRRSPYGPRIPVAHKPSRFLAEVVP